MCWSISVIFIKCYTCILVCSIYIICCIVIVAIINTKPWLYLLVHSLYYWFCSLFSLYYLKLSIRSTSPCFKPHREFKTFQIWASFKHIKHFGVVTSITTWHVYFLNTTIRKHVVHILCAKYTRTKKCYWPSFKSIEQKRTVLRHLHPIVNIYFPFNYWIGPVWICPLTSCYLYHVIPFLAIYRIIMTIIFSAFYTQVTVIFQTRINSPFII